MSIEQRLKELNITLPKVGNALGNYVHAKRVGNLLYLSGKGPEGADGSMPRGKIGAGMSIEEGSSRPPSRPRADRGDQGCAGGRSRSG
jgi:hypothetical protein